MSGYVRIHRALIGHTAFRDDAEAMAFAWLVLRASWKPARLRYKGKEVLLERGQVCVSIRDMATALDRDKNWISRVLQRMKTHRMIETKTGTAALVITICNYNEYQAEPGSVGTVSGTIIGTDEGQARDTEQGRKEGKEKNPKGFVLPDDLPADEWAAFVDMRNRIKKPMTDYAKRLAAMKLQKFRDEDDHDPVDVLNNSILNSYQALVPPKRDNRKVGPWSS